MTLAGFYEVLAGGSRNVKVEGIFRDGVFNAGKAQFRNSD
jgi:hypothetical protein